MKIYINLLITFILICCSTNAQEQEIISVGAYGGYGYNILSGSFMVDHGGGLTPTFSCGLYENGIGNGFVFGNMISKEIFSRFHLSFMPEYSVRNGIFSFLCVDPANIRLPNGSVTKAITNNLAEITHSLLLLRLNGEFQVFNNIPFRVLFGPTISLSLNSSYLVHEEIVSPNNAEFLNGGQVHYHGNSEFSDSKALSYGFNIGEKYFAPIANNLSMFLECSYIGGLTNEIEIAKIKSSQIRGIIGIENSFKSSKEIPIIKPPIVVVPVEPILNLKIKTDIFDENGNNLKEIKLNAKRVITSELYPLLNYLFFDKDSNKLPERYTILNEVDYNNFDLKNLKGKGAFATYYNILNIIGKRLNNNKTTKLLLKARISDGESNILQQQRLNFIVDYLFKICKVSKNQIAIQISNSKDNLSNSEIVEGKDENRRIELSSDNPLLLSSILISDTLYKTYAPLVNIIPEVNHNDIIKNWNLNIISNNQIIQSRKGIDSIPSKIEWNTGNDFQINKSSNLVLKNDSIATNPILELNAETNSGKIINVKYSIPISRTIIDSNLHFGSGYFSLILFDYNSSVLKSEHQNAINIVNSRTEVNSKTLVEGYTDKLGDEKLNQTLSQARANAVSSKLTSNVISVIGKGESDLFDNKFPEGRFYSRTVTIKTGD